MILPPRDRRRFLIAMTSLGVVLLGLAFFLQRNESRRQAAPLPEPPWRVAERRGDFFEHQLRALAADDSAAIRRAANALRASCMGDSGAIRFSMTRSLNSGHVFDAEVELDVRSTGSQQVLEWTVRRPAVDPVRLRTRIRAGAIVAVERSTVDAEAWQGWSGAEAMPLALGDLLLSEAVALGRALAAGGFRPIGFVSGMGSQPQVVFEIDLPDTAAARAGGAHGNLAAGSRALAYVDSATCLLRAIRAFDAKDYMVRIYADATWEILADRPQLVAVTVTSFADNSRTALRRLP